MSAIRMLESLHFSSHLLLFINFQPTCLIGTLGYKLRFQGGEIFSLTPISNWIPRGKVLLPWYPSSASFQGGSNAWRSNCQGSVPTGPLRMFRYPSPEEAEEGSISSDHPISCWMPRAERLVRLLRTSSLSGRSPMGALGSSFGSSVEHLPCHQMLEICVYYEEEGDCNYLTYLRESIVTYGTISVLQ